MEQIQELARSTQAFNSQRTAERTKEKITREKVKQEGELGREKLRLESERTLEEMRLADREAQRQHERAMLDRRIEYARLMASGNNLNTAWSGYNSVEDRFSGPSVHSDGLPSFAPSSDPARSDGSAWSLM